MADFKETLEVKKNSTCFLSYSFRWSKEDLADETIVEYEVENDATLGKVVDLIEGFCGTADKCYAAVDALFNRGRIQITEEY